MEPIVPNWVEEDETTRKPTMSSKICEMAILNIQ
jgi:hypothetical protein